MRKLKDIFSRQYVKDAAKAFYDKNLADKEKRRVFGFNVGSTVASAALGMGVMAAVKAATVAAVTTLAGASTAFTLGAATAAGAPVAAVLIFSTVVGGLASGVFRNSSDRKALAKAGQDVPKFWSRENGKAFFAKGNLLTMGLSAGASLLGGLFVVDFATQTPSAGPAQAFNSMAEAQTNPITAAEVTPAIEPSTAVTADALKADPLTASPAPTAPAPAPNPIAKPDTLGEFIRSIIAREPAAPTMALDPLAASAVTPTADFVATPEPAAVSSEAVAATVPTPPDATPAVEAPYIDPADEVAAALDKGTPPSPVVVPDAPVNAADGTPAESITAPDKVVLPEVPAVSTPAVEAAANQVVPASQAAEILPPTAADTPTVAPAADPAPASTSAAPATAEPKAYEGQKVGECTVKEVLTGWFNDSSYPPTNPTSVFDMECKVAPSAQTGDYVVLNGVADYAKKFGSTVTMEWSRVRDLVGQAELWIAPQVENRLNDHLYGGLGNVQVNASIKPLPL